MASYALAQQRESILFVLKQIAWEGWFFKVFLFKNIFKKYFLFFKIYF
jgi:hypothetical protein